MRDYTFLSKLLGKHRTRRTDGYILLDPVSASHPFRFSPLTIDMVDWWSVHYSPMIGRIAGTRGPTKEDADPNKPGKSVATFQANKLQLGGPVPAELKHHYVGYRPFITWLFTQKGLRGRILHYGLKRQYGMVYYYSKSTETGVVGVTNDDEADKDEEETLEKQIATRFLEMCHWGEGGRLYTYIIMLDGEWHFTETGPEFAIDMLSKHSMHSNIAPDIAYSGEFFVQELDANESAQSAEAQAAEESNGESKDNSDAPANEHSEGNGRPSVAMEGKPSASTKHTKNSKIRPRDPKQYELIIDNDSGTLSSPHFGSPHTHSGRPCTHSL